MTREQVNDCMLQFLADPKIGRLWLSHGGDRTVESYGVRPPGRSRRKRYSVFSGNFAKLCLRRMSLFSVN